ncbi:MAG TPA: serine hydrolase [Acetobacteraceae bacterium]|nr:serine hydrolase [Acetobacteraceae bacterium]
MAPPDAASPPTEPAAALRRQLIAAGAKAGLTEETLAFSLSVPARRLALGHNVARPFYPCSVVKIFWLVACLAQIEEGALTPHVELDRALHDMIAWSSNTATNYVIDLISGTTGDTLLEAEDFAAWSQRRHWANRYFRALGWPEMAAVNVCQKAMDDDRYGRERQFLGPDRGNHNRLTTASVARLLVEIFAGETLPAALRRRAAGLLARPHDPGWAEAHPQGQVRGYFGAGLPADVLLFSKAGWTSWTGDAAASYRRHDAAWIEAPGIPGFALVVFTEGRAISEDLSFLPAAAVAALALVRESCSADFQTR